MKIDNEINKDITLFCSQSCTIRRKIHQVQMNLLGEIYKVKMVEKRLNEIAAESLNFRTRLIKFVEKFQSEFTWVESNSTFPEHFPQKTSKGLKIEMELL